MSTFDQREDSFEKRYVHDEELRFKAEARRNKLVGLWAAGILGKTGDDAKAYAASVVAEDIKEHGEEDVARKLITDLGPLSDEVTIRSKMAELMREAKAQLVSEA